MRVVAQLAEKVGVSKSMAKYRMIELGFQEAECIYCFVDKKKLPITDARELGVREQRTQY